MRTARPLMHRLARRMCSSTRLVIFWSCHRFNVVASFNDFVRRVPGPGGFDCRACTTHRGLAGRSGQAPLRPSGHEHAPHGQADRCPRWLLMDVVVVWYVE